MHLKPKGSTVLCVALGASLLGCSVYERDALIRDEPVAGAERGGAVVAVSPVPRGELEPNPEEAELRVAESIARPRAMPDGGPREGLDDDAGGLESPGADAGQPPDVAGRSSPAMDAGCAGADARCCPTGAVGSAEGGCGYGFRRLIVLDGAQVSETLQDFPVLVRIDDEHLRAHAAEGGEDIFFTADDGETPLDFEIEHYSSAGKLVAWVRVPTLSAGTDTELFISYGDGASDHARGREVWAGFQHVWHLSQDPSRGDEAIRDATARSHGTAHGSMTSEAMVAGVAAGGLSFDGRDDEITFVNDLVGSGPSTFSGWVKQAGNLGEYGTSMLSVGDGSADGSARFMLSRADYDQVKCGFFGDDDLTTAILPLEQWKYLTWTWDGSESSVYLDGVRVLGPARHSWIYTTGRIGKIGNTTFRFPYFMYGQLDELRIASTARSGAWIATEYANQRPGSRFVKVVGEPRPAVRP